MFGQCPHQEKAILSEALKVGELARRTGLTVRTLHHYDEIGLLRPSLHTGSGHRLYTAEDMARLQRVLSLRQLGFSLEEIRDCLDRAGFSPLEVLHLHVTRLQEQIQLQQQLCSRLVRIADQLRTAEEVSAEDFLQTIEGMMMIEKYYTPEQLEVIKRRGEEAGPQRIKQVENEWPVLIAQVREEKEKGTDPTSPQVLELARRWKGLVNEFTGGDPGIAASVRRLWQEQGDAIATQHGAATDPRDVSDYIGKAIAALDTGK